MISPPPVCQSQTVNGGEMRYMKKISKLNIDLFGSYEGKTLEEQYNEARLKCINEETSYMPGGFMSSGSYVKNPQAGEAKWNQRYPKGIESWNENFMKLNSVGQQQVIDKINEIINFINKKK